MKTRQLVPAKRDAKPRPRLTERNVLSVLLAQGAVIPCGICRLAFAAEDVPFIERDHRLAEHSVPDDEIETRWADLAQQRYVHGRLDPRHPCHAEKTREDRRIHAKHDRIKGITGAGPKRKIQSAGFKGHRKFDGEIVWSGDKQK